MGLEAFAGDVEFPLECFGYGPFFAEAHLAEGDADGGW